MNITTHLLIALFSSPALTSGDLEDLCDFVNPDTGVPVRCEPRGFDVPVYAEAVCCDEVSCYKSENGWCPDILQPYYCELGEVLASNEVACYFEVPDYCDLNRVHDSKRALVLAQGGDLPITRQIGRNWLNVALDDAELRRHGPHTLRHYAECRVMPSGCPRSPQMHVLRLFEG